jgi:hypothetical protein
LCNEPIFVQSKIDKAMIIDVEDKVTAQESEYGIESIVNYELATRDSRIDACAELLVTAIEKTQ